MSRLPSPSALRIAHIVYRFPCLSEPFIMDQITGMLDRGHDVRIFADAGPTTDPVNPQVHAYGLLERTRYLPRVAVVKHRRLRQALKTLLARPALFRSPLLRRGLPAGERIRHLAKLHGFVWPRSPQYDIVHCQFGCVGRTYWRAKLLWNAKLVVSFRGHDFSSLPRMLGPGMYKELFQEVDAVMAVCQYAANRLIELGCPPEKLVTHFSGTDVEHFAFRERAVAPGAAVRLLTVARLEESKGIEYVLRAVATLVHRHGLNVRYGIAGNGSLADPLKNLATSLGLQDHVTFHGAVSRPQVRQLLDEHHLFVLPSVTTVDGGQEGIPGSVREAMATGMPVVSTWHAGIPELVTDGVSGYLVPERNVEQLADRLRALVTRPGDWPEMGRQGRAHVRERFDIHPLNQRLEAFYRHVHEGGVPAEFEARERAESAELAAV